jgi:hypothetical protein
MQTLIAEPDRTEMAFETIAALSGHDWERLFQALRRRSRRARAAHRAAFLARDVVDRAALRARSEGSFGANTPPSWTPPSSTPRRALVEAELDSMAAAEVENLDSLRAYLSDRVRDTHDLFPRAHGIRPRRSR